MQPEDGSDVAGDKDKDEGRMKSVKVLRVLLDTTLTFRLIRNSLAILFCFNKYIFLWFR